MQSLMKSMKIANFYHSHRAIRRICVYNINLLIIPGSKEVAFIHAITSAGVVHSLAKACRDGSLEDCGCDPRRTRGSSKDSEGKFDWTGCSNNIKFGLKFARLFIDAKESETRDGRGLMNLHNNNLGRRVGDNKAYIIVSFT